MVMRNSLILAGALIAGCSVPVYVTQQQVDEVAPMCDKHDGVEGFEARLPIDVICRDGLRVRVFAKK